jgi:fucose 4-O-acetylase-like acetyltransferase
MHSLSRYTAETNQQLANIVDWVDGAVVGFFFISGYLYKAQPDVYGYAKKQAIRLLVPFVLFSLAYTVALAILGKLSIQQGVIATLTLHGAGMQLYFLPFLLIVTVGFAFFGKFTPAKYQSNSEWYILLAVAILCFALPTDGSTGSDYKLLSLYLLGFLLGKHFKSSTQLTPQIGIVLAGLLMGNFDPRFFDVAGIIALFVLLNSISNLLPSRRLPGSGGVYLLHTPLVNFSVSAALIQIGITQVSNIYISVLVTYLLCLAVTLVAVQKLPKFKWMLLE